MAKGKSTAEQQKQIEAQRREAQAALKRNRVSTGRGKFRSLTPRERSAYQRVIKRTDKLLGPVRKRGPSGVEGLRSGLRTLKAFAERVRAGREEFEKIPKETE